MQPMQHASIHYLYTSVLLFFNTSMLLLLYAFTPLYFHTSMLPHLYTAVPHRAKTVLKKQKNPLTALSGDFSIKVTAPDYYSLIPEPIVTLAIDARFDVRAAFGDDGDDESISDIVHTSFIQAGLYGTEKRYTLN
ncbi:hypothetical protein DNH61_07325 [Paenibacillus sambharensis]|uniref:Uncharacterized protein n=1 Tax=Paenibacillus sambharensis TaxID=1803190 RepID=A0A2W1L8U0_9BACL|nr:hypothetical protein DNH61_07325 [Paenibacillus sambharensis]